MKEMKSNKPPFFDLSHRSFGSIAVPLSMASYQMGRERKTWISGPQRPAGLKSCLFRKGPTDPPTAYSSIFHPSPQRKGSRSSFLSYRTKSVADDGGSIGPSTSPFTLSSLTYAYGRVLRTGNYEDFPSFRHLLVSCGWIWSRQALSEYLQMLVVTAEAGFVG